MQEFSLTNDEAATLFMAISKALHNSAPSELEELTDLHMVLTSQLKLSRQGGEQE